MANLGFTEIMLILLVVLLLFGAKRLPEVGASFGKGIREFKRSLSDTQEAIMGTDEQRNLSQRQPDAPPQSTTSAGEPKRLSQSSGNADGPAPRCGPFVVSVPRRQLGWGRGAACCCSWSLARLSTTLADSRSAARKPRTRS